MKKVLLTLFITMASAVPATAADTAAIAESFQRDAERNHSQLTSEVYARQDFVQNYINRELNGSDALYASFKRDLYRVPTPSQRIGARGNTLQQQINVALRYQRNPLLASFERNLGVTILTIDPAARRAIILGLNCEGGLWRDEPLTAFA